MDLVRRSAVIILGGAMMGFASPGAAGDQQTPAALRLDAPGNGALTIVNIAAVPATIERTIAVEAGGPEHWEPIVTEFAAIARCETPAPKGPVTLAAGASLIVVPWRGFSCSGQCNDICRANVYYGAGPFRFVVATAGGSVASAPFSMPAEPHP